jgi:uncharacterized membrane protein SirB2
MLHAHAHNRTILVHKCVKICIQFLWTRTQSEWKKFNLPKWKWVRLLLAVDTSLVRVSEWQTKGDATLSRWNAPHIVALLLCSGDAGVVLLIETSSQIHRGHCNWLTRGVHSRYVETCLYRSCYVRKVPSWRFESQGSQRWLCRSPDGLLKNNRVILFSPGKSDRDTKSS